MWDNKDIIAFNEKIGGGEEEEERGYWDLVELEELKDGGVSLLNDGKNSTAENDNHAINIGL